MKTGAPEPIAALNRVKIRETGEPLVNIREFCPHVEVPEKVCPYLRETVAQMLNRAASTLPAGYRFRVSTALRTLSMQRSGWDSFFQKMKEEHPGWPLSALKRATNRYFAPYDQPAPPGHCTGAAVDVILLGPDGEPADVTSPTEGWQAAYTWSDLISPEAKHNRMVLVDAMLGAGFSNCRDEYWHYSYGDSAWAVRVGEHECPYGLVEAPVRVESGFPGAAGEIDASGAHAWTARPVDGTLTLGVFWAEGKEVLLRLEGLEDPALFTSADKEKWEPLEAQRQHGALLLALRPTTPRMYITTSPPEPRSEDGDTA